MAAKLLFVVALCYLNVVRGDDCAWADSEKNENCCNLPNVRGEFAKVCADKLDYQYPPVKTDKLDICGEECVYLEAGFMSADKKLNGDTIMEKGMKLEPKDWVPTIHLGVEHCNAQTFDNGDGKCAEGPAKYTHCLVNYLYSHCPTNYWKNTDTCNTIKEKLVKCPQLIAPPHPFSIIPK